MRRFVLLSLLFFPCLVVCSQADSLQLDSLELKATIVAAPVADQEVYRLKPGADIPITAIGAGWSLYAFTKIYNKDSSSLNEILSLNRNDVSAFNRHGIDEYSKKAKKTSDYLFYGSMPLPLLLLADKEIRKDAGKVGLLFLESMSITGLLYTGSVYFVDKYRPYAYNPVVPMAERRSGGAKNSFFAGHPALVGTSTFFMAKVYSDYHPESRIKWLLYTLAGTATVATGYLRYKGGLHFLSDIIIGTAVGPLSGILVPHFHKTGKGGSGKISLVPFYGHQQGVSLVWRL